MDLLSGCSNEYFEPKKKILWIHIVFKLLANKKLKHSNHLSETSNVELRYVYLLIKKKDRDFFIIDTTDNFRKENLLLKHEFKLDRTI